MSNSVPSPPTGPDVTRIAGAEFLGTLVLMIVGPGTAILAADAVGALGVALAFGFALLIMAYAIGHISGCHINPAVTLAFVVTGKLDVGKAIFYWVAQAAGALVGALLLFIATEGGDLDKTVSAATGKQIFAANGWGDEIGSPFGLGAVVIVEIVFTALLIFVVLSTTTAGFSAGFGGLAAGITLGAMPYTWRPLPSTTRRSIRHAVSVQRCSRAVTRLPSCRPSSSGLPSAQWSEHLCGHSSMTSG